MIAITGSESGFLSSRLRPQFWDARFIPRHVRKSVEKLEAWLSVIKPDCVIHCAGLANVRACIDDPILAHEVNTGDTITLLKALDGRGIKLIYIATDKVFGDQENCTLQTAYKPLNAYDLSKVAAEVILANWAARNPCILARFPNFYGPGDPHTERLIPSVLQAIEHKQEKFVVRTNADSTRQYIFIDDVVNIVGLLVASDCPCEKHHFGTPIVKSVREVITDLCALLGHSMVLEEQNLIGEASKLSLAYESPLQAKFTSWPDSLKSFRSGLPMSP